MLKAATWNVNSLRVRLPQVLAWLSENQPDILALQETKLPDADFPLEAIKEAGYLASYSGQRTYNGVATLSKTPGKDIVMNMPGFDDPQRRLLAAKYGAVWVVNVYVPNGARVSSEKYRYKLDWLAALREYLSTLVHEQAKVIVLGDFNIAPADRDVHDPEAWQGQVLVSEPEREALRDLMDLGLEDGFRLFEQESGAFSWWDYRAGAFRRNNGLRIDLILVSRALVTSCSACVIDKKPRALPRPSDHAPVIAEFDLC